MNQKVFVGTRLPNCKKVVVVVSDAAGCVSQSDLPIRSDLADKSKEFDWGYAGSGPAQLALAICADALGDDVARNPNVFQEFKREFLLDLGDRWEITERDVVDWHNLKTGAGFLAQITQYISPNGRKIAASTVLPIAAFEAYRDMLSARCRLEAEVLQTGHVSLTIANDDDDIDSRIVVNGPDVKSGARQVARGRLHFWRKQRIHS